MRETNLSRTSGRSAILFPGSEINTYKEEIYKRIAFADSRFGVGSGTDGWRTDRGRTYITLGAPQQKDIHRGAANLRAFEILVLRKCHPYFFRTPLRAVL